MLLAAAINKNKWLSKMLAPRTNYSSYTLSSMFRGFKQRAPFKETKVSQRKNTRIIGKCMQIAWIHECSHKYHMAVKSDGIDAAILVKPIFIWMLMILEWMLYGMSHSGFCSEFSHFWACLSYLEIIFRVNKLVNLTLLWTILIW